jgi:hypothetical protein
LLLEFKFSPELHVTEAHEEKLKTLCIVRNLAVHLLAAKPVTGERKVSGERSRKPTNGNGEHQRASHLFYSHGALFFIIPFPPFQSLVRAI